jgi:uncharacterized protein YjbI with pentapeptide repeats
MKKTFQVVGCVLGMFLIVAILWLAPRWQAARLKGQVQTRIESARNKSNSGQQTPSSSTPTTAPSPVPTTSNSDSQQLTLKDEAQIEIDIAKAEVDARNALLQLLTVLVAFLGFYISLRSLKENLALAIKNAKQTEEDKLAERFGKAVEYFSKEETRLGGIYALGQIAEESAEYYWVIMELLTAHVRSITSQSSNTLLTPQSSIVLDATLAVMGRPSGQFEKNENRRLNLRNTILRGRDLREANLRWAILSDSDLSEALLNSADLSFARMHDIKLNKAKLTRTILRGADMSEAQFIEARLSGSHLDKAQLTGANFTSADLTDTMFSEADCNGAIFSGAYLQGADLSGARNLTWEQIDTAHIDEQTKVPPQHKEKTQRKLKP